ncbi:Lsr2 family protein [Cryptosporangium sp. NPDC048952]|uniref:histone-like nucleoid-structuring protein Lsr2 n=1 Tax=Cryptosporangium sp. NPDC048952 TaxID=3363961 RepID=UPI00370FC3A2
MARKVEVLLVDDIDGSAAQETVAFDLDGTSYEIDLSEANAGVLRAELARYVEAARKAGKAPRASRTVRGSIQAKTPAASRERSQAVREWAKQNGFAVSERGRIPADLVEKYRAAAGS